MEVRIHILGRKAAHGRRVRDKGMAGEAGFEPAIP